MAVHTLSRSRLVEASPEACWAFFSDPRNLARITPPDLGFEIVSDLPDRIHPGLMIEYRVRPLFGIPVTWLTEITQVEEGRYFVDEQRVGPYAVWHHEHRFTPVGTDQTRCDDLVHYVPPLGPLGDLAHPFLIRPRLEAIFAYRETRIPELLGRRPPREPAGSRG